MASDLIRYDLLVQEALRSVLRKVLADAARDGLPATTILSLSSARCARRADTRQAAGKISAGNDRRPAA